MAKHWIKNAIKRPGALHAHLGVPAGEPIPAEKLEKAAHSKNSTVRREASLAKTLKGMHHEKKSNGGGVKSAMHQMYRS